MQVLNVFQAQPLRDGYSGSGLTAICAVLYTEPGRACGSLGLCDVMNMSHLWVPRSARCDESVTPAQYPYLRPPMAIAGLAPPLVTARWLADC
eukprot:9164781-Pyramimonas_sp.AAC.2